MKESKKYTVKERIIHYLKESKITQSEFCKRVGLSSGYIGAMRKSFQPDTINKIVIEFPDLDITWLLTGEGEMLKNGIAHEPDNGTTIGSGRVIPYYDAEVAAGTGYGDDADGTRRCDRNRRPAQRQRICDACLRQQHGSELSCRMRDRTAPI